MTSKPKVSAQEFADISNLYAYYNLCSDAGDAEGYASCFAEDAVLTIETIGMVITGRDTLREFKRKDKAGRGDMYRRHWNSGLYLERIDAHTIRGRCYLQAFNGKPGSLPMLADCGVYEDMLMNVDGAWKFARRTIRMDASSFKDPMAR